MQRVNVFFFRVRILVAFRGVSLEGLVFRGVWGLARGLKATLHIIVSLETRIRTLYTKSYKYKRNQTPPRRSGGTAHASHPALWEDTGSKHPGAPIFARP